MNETEYLEDPSREGNFRGEGGMTFSAILRSLRPYRNVILLSLLAVAVGYFLLAMTYALLRPVQRTSTLAFRLEFPGADIGQYPNGVRFSGSDIIDTPVLRAVYDANQLGRFMSFSNFSRAVVVLESNAALDMLAREYEAKLANARLTAVERERLEAQFQQKRESLLKNEYALTLATQASVTKVPPSVTSKVLYDILRTWADFAASSRQVMTHRVPLVSQQTIALHADPGEDLLASLLYLRIAANELQKNIDALSSLPGAGIVRSNKRKLSLPELELELTHIQRAGIEYLISSALRNNTDRARAVAVLEAQLAYDTRAHAAAEERVRVLRATLDDYVRKNADLPQQPQQPGGATSTPESIVVTDSFLNNIVSLAQNASDLQYRQRYVDEIRTASIATIPLRSIVEYERQLLTVLQSGGGGGTAAPVPELRAREAVVIRQIQAIATDLQEVRGILSRGLTASGQMYSVVSPPVNVAERGVSMVKLFGGGVILLIAAAVAAVLIALLQAQWRNARQPVTA